VITPAKQTVGAAVRPGLRENLGQFALLVVVNVLVGAMVGLERSILPPTDLEAGANRCAVR
jgi:hypothetical protein